MANVKVPEQSSCQCHIDSRYDGRVHCSGDNEYCVTISIANIILFACNCAKRNELQPRRHISTDHCLGVICIAYIYYYNAQQRCMNYNYVVLLIFSFP